MPSNDAYRAALDATEEAMIRLEMVEGLPVWEAQPGPKHQRLVVAITNSVADCGCYALADVSVSFPDGSFKRPDVAIFCQRPDEEAPSVSLVPEAVVEVLSRGY